MKVRGCSIIRGLGGITCAASGSAASAEQSQNGVKRANAVLQRAKQNPFPIIGYCMTCGIGQSPLGWRKANTPVDVQHWMGHSSITVTMAYNHYVPKHLRATADEPTSAPQAEQQASVR